MVLRKNANGIDSLFESKSRMEINGWRTWIFCGKKKKLGILFYDILINYIYLL